MRKRLLLVSEIVLAASVAVGIVIAALWILRPQHPPLPFTRRQMEQVRIGMTQEQIEALLRAPPGDYVTRAHRPPLEPREPDLWHEDQINWTCDEGELWVLLDKERKVEGILITNVRFLEEPTLFDRLRAKLGL